MFKISKSQWLIISALLIIIASFFLYNSFESRFNNEPRDMKLTYFKNTKHFNISIFGEDLSEKDIQWTMNLAERYYERMDQWYGNQSGKEWLTIYIAKDFPTYYRPNDEMILIASDRVKNQDARYILIKITHLLTGSYKWPWYKNHIAAEGLAAYFTDRFLNKHFDYKKKYEGQADLAVLDKANHFVWKMSEDQQAYVYAKAGAFMEYLINKYGIKKIKELYAEQGNNWSEVFGNDLEALYRQWEARF